MHTLIPKVGNPVLNWPRLGINRYARIGHVYHVHRLFGVQNWCQLVTRVSGVIQSRGSYGLQSSAKCDTVAYITPDCGMGFVPCTDSGVVESTGTTCGLDSHAGAIDFPDSGKFMAPAFFV